MVEIWKDIPDFDHKYEVSNIGRVRIISTGLIMKTPLTFGYAKLGLIDKDGKHQNAKVHRLVMAAFVGKSDRVVDHINGVKDDNRLENLEYVSVRENNRRFRNRVKSFTGVYWNKANNKWKAQIRFEGKNAWLGYHKTQQEASDAYLSAFKSIETKGKLPKSQSLGG